MQTNQSCYGTARKPSQSVINEQRSYYHVGRDHSVLVCGPYCDGRFVAHFYDTFVPSTGSVPASRFVGTKSVSCHKEAIDALCDIIETGRLQ